MEWWLVLVIVVGAVVGLLVMGLPVAFAFLVVCFAGASFLLRGLPSVEQIGYQVFDSLTHFTLVPVTMFILMGETMFQSGMAFQAIDAIDKWIGRLPGRLSLMVIAAGTFFAALSGSTMANTAMLGSVVLPEMKKRGYSKPMSIGPIIGVGGLAMLIPPSALAVIYASIADISVARVLIAGAVPGVMIGFFYAIYCVGRSYLRPKLAPPYDTPPEPISSKFIATAKYVLPLLIIIFLVLGLIFLGVATPSEAGATGAMGSFLLAIAYRRLNWKVLRDTIIGSTKVIVMVFMIIAAAKSFTTILTFSGASRGLVTAVAGAAGIVPPLLILVGMQIILLFLGTFMEPVSIMLITVPIYMPIVLHLGFDPIWFAIVVLLNIEMAMTTPPFGLHLFVMKGIAPPDTTMGDIVRAGLPFLFCDAIAMILLFIFPKITLWLPSLML